MAYVITEKCAATCDTACVDACPCNCIVGPVPVDELRQVPAGERAGRFASLQMYVDPERCINCGACFLRCPADAIYLDENVPTEHLAAIARNAAFFQPLAVAS